MVIGRYLPAERYPRKEVEIGHHRVRYFAAYIVKIDVYAVGTGFGDLCCKVRGVVIERFIEAVFFPSIFTFFFRAGNAYHAATQPLAQLAHHQANRSRGAGYDEGFARFGFTDIQQAEISR